MRHLSECLSAWDNSRAFPEIQHKSFVICVQYFLLCSLHMRRKNSPFSTPVYSVCVSFVSNVDTFSPHLWDNANPAETHERSVMNPCFVELVVLCLCSSMVFVVFANKPMMFSP